MAEATVVGPCGRLFRTADCHPLSDGPAIYGVERGWIDFRLANVAYGSLESAGRLRWPRWYLDYVGWCDRRGVMHREDLTEAGFAVRYTAAGRLWKLSAAGQAQERAEWEALCRKHGIDPAPAFDRPPSRTVLPKLSSTKLQGPRLPPPPSP